MVGEGRSAVDALCNRFAGIVVTVTPLNSLTFLAVLFGIWFIVMGLFEIIGAFILRRALRTEGPPAG